MTEEVVNPNNKCCFCLTIPTAVLVMIVFAILGMLAHIRNILAGIGLFDGYIITGIVIIVANALAFFCQYKFLMVFYPYYKKKALLQSFLATASGCMSLLIKTGRKLLLKSPY